MKELFLSASVPIPGRGSYHETADPFLIQFAVRELIAAVIREHVVVWGGHPAITPMVWAICQDLGVNYAESTVLYQSQFFEELFPEENKHFGNTVLVPAITGDREASLLKMRNEMLSRSALSAAVFIGGMDGVEAEFAIFRHFHPDAGVVAVGAPGGAARDLALRSNERERLSQSSVDFARIFREELLPMLR
jgi:hypothetical protein